MLAVPNDLIGSSLVEAQAEGWLVLPHLASDVVTAAELIGEALAICIEHEATDTTQSLSGKELDLSIRVIWLDKACWVHLNPLQVDRLAPDRLTHLDFISGAVLAVG